MAERAFAGAAPPWLRSGGAFTPFRHDLIFDRPDMLDLNTHTVARL
jgi:hypothetical protein